MNSRKQTYGRAKAGSKQRPTKLASVQADTLSQPQTHPAAATQKSGLNPSLLTTDDILQLQRLIGNQKVVQLLDKREKSTTQNNSVVQRTILINGKTYHADQEGLFDVEQSDHKEGVERSLKYADFGRAPRTITEALKDKRTIEIKITKSKFNDKLLYEADTKDAYVKEEEGKNSREAGEIPVYISRPTQGVENLSIEGLLTCIGVVVEVIDKYGKTAGAAGGHFLTPQMYINEELQLRGMRFIHNINKLVAAQEGDKRFSLHCSGEADKTTGLALELLSAIFKNKGYTNQGTSRDKGRITYSLNDQGNSSIT